MIVLSITKTIFKIIFKVIKALLIGLLFLIVGYIALQLIIVPIGLSLVLPLMNRKY